MLVNPTRNDDQPPLLIYCMKRWLDSPWLTQAFGWTLFRLFVLVFQPEKFVQIPRIPLPRTKVKEWYDKPENRGVLEECVTQWNAEANEQAAAN